MQTEKLTVGQISRMTEEELLSELGIRLLLHGETPTTKIIEAELKHRNKQGG